MDTVFFTNSSYEVNRLNLDAAFGAHAAQVIQSIMAYGTDPALENVTKVLPIKSAILSIAIKDLQTIIDITPSIERSPYALGIQNSHTVKTRQYKLTAISEFIKIDPNLLQTSEGRQLFEALQKAANMRMHLKTLLMGLTAMMTTRHLYVAYGPYDNMHDINSFIAMVNLGIGCCQKGSLQFDANSRKAVYRIDQNYSIFKDKFNVPSTSSSLKKIFFVTRKVYDHILLNSEKNNKSANKTTVPKDYTNTLDFGDGITITCLSDSRESKDTPIEDLFTEDRRGIFGTYAEYNPFKLSTCKGLEEKIDSECSTALTVYTSDSDDLTGNISHKLLLDCSGIFGEDDKLGGVLGDYLKKDKNKAKSSFFYKNDRNDLVICKHFYQLKNYKILDKMGYLRHMSSTFKKNVLKLGTNLQVVSTVVSDEDKKTLKEIDEKTEKIKTLNKQAYEMTKERDDEIQKLDPKSTDYKSESEQITNQTKEKIDEALKNIKQLRTEITEEKKKIKNTSILESSSPLAKISGYFSVEESVIEGHIINNMSDTIWQDNKSFKGEFNNLEEIDKQIIVAFLLTDINKELVLKMANNGVTHPFIFRFIRPHQVYTTQGMLIAAQGGVVGNTYVGFDSVLKAPNTNEHTENISYKKHVAATIDRPDLMFIQKDVMISKYHSGLGVKICKPEKARVEDPNYDAYVMPALVGDFDSHPGHNMALNGLFEFESEICPGSIPWKPKPWYFFNYHYKFSSTMNKKNLIPFGTNGDRNCCLPVANVITEENYWCGGKYVSGGITAFSHSFDYPDSYQEFHNIRYNENSTFQKGEIVDYRRKKK